MWDVYAKWAPPVVDPSDSQFVHCGRFELNGNTSEELFRDSVKTMLVGFAPKDDNVQLVRVNLSVMSDDNIRFNLARLSGQIHMHLSNTAFDNDPHEIEVSACVNNLAVLHSSDLLPPVEPKKSLPSVLAEAVEPKKSLPSVRVKAAEPKKSLPSVLAEAVEPKKSLPSVLVKAAEPKKSLPSVLMEAVRYGESSTAVACAENGYAAFCGVTHQSIPGLPSLPSFQVNSRGRGMPYALTEARLSDEQIFSGTSLVPLSRALSHFGEGSIYFYESVDSDESMECQDEGFINGIKDAWIEYMGSQGGGIFDSGSL